MTSLAPGYGGAVPKNIFQYTMAIGRMCNESVNKREENNGKEKLPRQTFRLPREKSAKAAAPTDQSLSGTPFASVLMEPERIMIPSIKPHRPATPQVMNVSTI